jgi:hypothetical protein
LADFRSKNADVGLTNRLIKQGKLVTPLVASKSSRDY